MKNAVGVWIKRVQHINDNHAHRGHSHSSARRDVGLLYSDAVCVLHHNQPELSVSKSIREVQERNRERARKQRNRKGEIEDRDKAH